jgi:hypothetical protein
MLFTGFVTDDVNDSRSEHHVGELNLIGHTWSVLEKEYGRDRQTYQSIFPQGSEMFFRARSVLLCKQQSASSFRRIWHFFGCTIPGTRACNFTQVMTW